MTALAVDASVMLKWLFTLYHAVALSRPEGVLVTADEQHYRRAVGAGQFTLVRDCP